MNTPKIKTEIYQLFFSPWVTKPPPWQPATSGVATSLWPSVAAKKHSFQISCHPNSCQSEMALSIALVSFFFLLIYNRFSFPLAHPRRRNHSSFVARLRDQECSWERILLSMHVHYLSLAHVATILKMQLQFFLFFFWSLQGSCLQLRNFVCSFKHTFLPQHRYFSRCRNDWQFVAAELPAVFVGKMFAAS